MQLSHFKVQICGMLSIEMQHLECCSKLYSREICESGLLSFDRRFNINFEAKLPGESLSSQIRCVRLVIRYQIHLIYDITHCASTNET